MVTASLGSYCDKIIQILSTSSGDIYGLDSSGRLYCFNPNKKIWVIVAENIV